MKQNKRKSQYFEKLVNKYGKDWINIVSIPEMQKGVNYLFKDIAFDNIDKSLHLYAFTDNRFINAINLEALKSLRESTILSESLHFSFSNNPQQWNDAMILELIKKYDYRKTCYTVIVDGIAMFMNGVIPPVALLDYIGPKIRPYAIYL